MRLIMIEILIMSFGGFLFNPHYLHTLMHDVIKTHYEPPKFIMSISIIMSLIMTLLVFQCGEWGDTVKQGLRPCTLAPAAGFRLRRAMLDPACGVLFVAPSRYEVYISPIFFLDMSYISLLYMRCIFFF